MSDTVEIRWHGRGGQGVVTAAKVLAEAALGGGRYVQGFSEYGPERSGAPVKGYNRISDIPIDLHTFILEPDIVVVIDDSLLGIEPVEKGLPEGGRIVINTTMTPEEAQKKLGVDNLRVYTVNATQISIDCMGRPMPNTAMIGALVKATGVLDLDEVLNDVEKKFSQKFPSKVVDGNLESIRRAYEEVTGS